MWIGNCDIHAEWKILFIDNTKQNEIWPRLKGWVQKIFWTLVPNFVKGPYKSWIKFHPFFQFLGFRVAEQVWREQTVLVGEATSCLRRNSQLFGKFYQINFIHRHTKKVDRLHPTEIGLEHAGFVFPPPLNMQKNLLIMGPNKTKNCSFKVWFSHIKLWIFFGILFLL